jgi:hypothetical protein
VRPSFSVTRWSLPVPLRTRSTTFCDERTLRGWSSRRRTLRAPDRVRVLERPEIRPVACRRASESLRSTCRTTHSICFALRFSHSAETSVSPGPGTPGVPGVPGMPGVPGGPGGPAAAAET